MKRLALALLLLFCAPAFGQVAFVSDSTVSPAETDDNQTLTAVPGSTGNFLACGASYVGAGLTVSSFNYGATPMTLAVTTVSNNRHATIYYLANPAGTEDVALVLSGTSSRIALNCAIFSGAGTAPDDNDNNPFNAGSTSLTLTTTANSYLYDLVTKTTSTEGLTFGADQAEISSFSSGTCNCFHKASVQDGVNGGVMSWTWVTDPTQGSHVAINIPAAGGAAPPTIVDVDEDNTVTLEQTNISIDITDGVGAEAEVRQGAFTYGMSEDSANATEVVADMPAVPGVAPKHGAATVAVINDDAQEDTQAITIAAAAASDYVDLASVIGGGVPRITAVPDLEIADQVQWRNPTGSGVYDETDVEVFDDGSISWTEGVTAFEVRAWDHDDSAWSDWVEQTIDAAVAGAGGGATIIQWRRRGRR